MNVTLLPRVLRAVYPAAVFAGVLLSWSSLGQGLQSALIFPEPQKTEFDLLKSPASSELQACQVQDHLMLTPASEVR